jgi:hypothetical protein
MMNATAETLPQKERKKTREPEGCTRIELPDGRTFVNANELARIFGTKPMTVLAWTKLPRGLPYIQPPSRDPGRQGLRKMFDLKVAADWYSGFAQSPNPPRKLRGRVK